MITCSKTYVDIPFAHRQPKHKGHCAFIHGHNWSFKFTFGSAGLDENGFVIDFGTLKWVKEEVEFFDHALVLNDDDPWKPYLFDVLSKATGRPGGPDGNLAKLIIVPNCGCEGLAQYFFDRVAKGLASRVHGMDRQVWLMSVTVREDSRNEVTLTAGGL